LFSTSSAEFTALVIPLVQWLRGGSSEDGEFGGEGKAEEEGEQRFNLRKNERKGGTV